LREEGSRDGVEFEIVMLSFTIVTGSLFKIIHKLTENTLISSSVGEFVEVSFDKGDFKKLSFGIVLFPVYVTGMRLMLML
jgi:hypothetical protein